jgi:hypothetical protein
LTGIAKKDQAQLYAELAKVRDKWDDYEKQLEIQHAQSGGCPKDLGAPPWEEWRASMANGPDIYEWFTPIYYNDDRLSNHLNV